MTKKTIDRVEDLQDGDIATFEYASRKYTGPVFVDKDNDLRFMDWVVLWDRKGASSLADLFVSATREVPALPTEPLSVITDVSTDYGRKWAVGILAKGGGAPFWIVVDGAGQYDWLDPHRITSFKLAKVVRADA